MATILGISAFYHDSAACLLRDGAIVAAAQEERFSRVKNDRSFPAAAVRYCLDAAGIDVADADMVVFYEHPDVKLDRLLETWLSTAPRGFRSFRAAAKTWFGWKMTLAERLESDLAAASRDSRPPRRLLFSTHHKSHAASAFYPSGFDSAAVLCLDAVGEWATTTAWKADGRTLDLIWQLDFPHSLGLLYSAFTYHAGFKVNSGEYKLMGLAPYGRPVYADRIRDVLIDLKDDGSFRLDTRYLDCWTASSMTNERFARLFDGPPRQPESDLTQREADLAASIQQVTEEVILRQAVALRHRTKATNLCLAGGVALNSVANGRALREAGYDRVWIQPAAGDAGGAVGAAFLGWHEVLGTERFAVTGDVMAGAFLGPRFGGDDVERFLRGVGARFTRATPDDVLESAVRSLAAGDVVGWFQGRMEFGPRALGGRSILADPRPPGMQRHVNKKIKYRESFRPFASAILAHRARDFFDLDAASPYMQFVADVVPAHRIAGESQRGTLASAREPLSDIPAVTHVDYSSRVQTVDRQTNRRFFDLLERWEARTGCPLLLNTSLNVRGEPIVCTPEDAYHCFTHTAMDVLVLEDCLVEKIGGEVTEGRNHRHAVPLD